MFDPLHHIRLRHRFFEQVESEDEQHRRVCSLLPSLMAGFGASSSYQIARSVRIRGANGNYFSRTFGGAGSTQKLTFSIWAKRSTLATEMEFLSSAITSLDAFRFTPSDQIRVLLGNGTGDLTSTPVYRDPSAPMHVMLAIDTTQATAANRIRVYVNGAEITAWGTNIVPAQNYALVDFNKAQAHAIGRYAPTASRQFDGYFSEAYFVDGQQLTPSSFGQTDPTTGAWSPIKYTGTYGTNGFYLDFSDNSAATAAAIGADRSGNGNNWTPNNFSVTAGSTNDSLVDTPTNYGVDTGAGGQVRGNYPSFSPLDKGANATLSDANLTVTWSSYAGGQSIRIPFDLTASGKWYWECLVNANTNGNASMGIQNAAAPLSNFTGIDANGWALELNNVGTFTPVKITNNVSSSFGGSQTSSGIGTVYGFAFDASTGNFYVRDATGWMNASNSSDASPTTAMFTISTAAPLFPACAHNSGLAQTSGETFNAGQRAFAYTAPTGYKALCTQNLATPAIVKPASFFDINLRTGTGAAFNVTGKAFQPDFVWSKGRSGATSHALFDSVRGAQADLASDSTAAEVTDTQGLSAFNSDGFSGGTLAKLNTNAATYVDWLWKKGVTPGLDVVGYAGNATNPRTISHALGVKPAMVIVRDRTVTRDWYVWHQNLATDNNVFLELSNAQAPVSGSGIGGILGSTTTSSVFGLGAGTTNGNGVNASGSNYVAYVFAEVPGFSKFGSYTGNGAADGPFVFCGFRPRWVMCKIISSTSDWEIEDSARSVNGSDSFVLADSSGAESGSGRIDILSNGFKIRNTGTNQNSSGATYIFAAFAETPFKYARAR